MSITRCLLCWRKGVVGEDGGSYSGNFSILENSTRVIFLLEKLLQIPEDEIARLFEHDHGHPSEWVKICQTCTPLTEQGAAIFRQISQLQTEFWRIQTIMRDQITLGKQEVREGDDDNEEEDFMGKQIRVEVATRRRQTDGEAGEGRFTDDVDLMSYDEFTLGGEIIPDCDPDGREGSSMSGSEWEGDKITSKPAKPHGNICKSKKKGNVKKVSRKINKTKVKVYKARERKIEVLPPPIPVEEICEFPEEMKTRKGGEKIAARVVHFYLNDANRNRSKTYAHFKLCRSRRGVRSILNRYVETGEVKFKQRGPPPKHSAKLEQLQALMYKYPSTNGNAAAKWLSIPPRSTRRMLKKIAESPPLPISALDAIMLPPAPLDPDVICDQCGKTYSLPVNLQKHIKEVHDSRLPGAERYPCDICGKVMRTKDKLKVHRQIHINPANAQHLCTICGNTGCPRPM